MTNNTNNQDNNQKGTNNPLETARAKGAEHKETQDGKQAGNRVDQGNQDRGSRDLNKNKQNDK